MANVKGKIVEYNFNDDYEDEEEDDDGSEEE